MEIFKFSFPSIFTFVRERLKNELIFNSLDFCVGLYIMVSSLESGGSVSKSWVKLVIQWAIWSNLDLGDLGQDPQFGKIHRKLESCSSPWARLIIDPFMAQILLQVDVKKCWFEADGRKYYAYMTWRRFDSEFYYYFLIRTCRQCVRGP